jgi:heme exporter protein C
MRPLDKVRITLLVVAAILTLVSIYLAVLYAPTHTTMGDVQRIFYFHVSSAWVAYMGFGLTFVTSLLYMKTKDLKWDVYAYSSAQIGVVFCTLAITTGPMWAKAVWGVYWRWEDLKLMMTLVLWLVFIAYLVLRANVQSRRKKANLSAVFSIIGLICIPLSFAANRLWSQYHPTVIATEEGSLQASMGFSFGIALLAFTILFIYILLTKIEIETMRETVEELKQKVGGRHG